MSRLLEAYRGFHEQGFIPIFVQDHFDSKLLVEACVKAGMKGVEYTLRRKDADTMIPWIRQAYPDLYLLVGSTLDDDRIAVQRKRYHPQLMTVKELDRLEVDGFVSMIGWSLESIREYAAKRIIVPTAMTVTEAFQQTGAGAHFIKLNGKDLSLVKRCRDDAAFDYCPIMVTGGASLERIPSIVDAGAAAVGTGFDLILKDTGPEVTVDEVADILRQYLHAVQEARAAKWPQMSKAIGGDTQAWLDSLPHYHPFH